MVKMQIVYDGDKRCTATHLDSHAQIQTDAPKDIGGLGASFSPTDLVGAALASCIATTMAMYAERHEMNLKGIQVQVTKEMTVTAPRRIARLATTVMIPAGLVPEEKRAALEQIGHTCPVHKSLNPDMEAPIEFLYV